MEIPLLKRIVTIFTKSLLIVDLDFLYFQKHRNTKKQRVWQWNATVAPSTGQEGEV